MNKFTINSSRNTFYILGTLFGLMLGSLIWSIFYSVTSLEPNTSMFIFLIIGALLMDLWLYQYKIIINGNNITASKSLFNFLHKQSININNINEMNVKTGVVKGKNGFYTLNLIASRKKKVQINIKPFSKKEIIQFIQYILRQNKNIKIDGFVEDLYKEDFNAFVKKGLSKHIGSLIYWLIFIGIIVAITVKLIF